MNNPASFLYPEWPAPPNIRALSTFRAGGVSKSPFNSLNLAAHVGDNLDSVVQNRAIISRDLGLPTEPIWLEQIHSDRAIEAIYRPLPEQADASYTSKIAVVCAVLTADCLPLLICSKDGLQVAAVHAGWKGLLAGVVTNTIKALQKASSQNSGYMVWLGPAIGPKCFEVGAEVHEAFVRKHLRNESAFIQVSKDKWLADIYHLARIELTEMRITDVYSSSACTFTENELYYSYRRDSQTGRMASLIWRES